MDFAAFAKGMLLGVSIAAPVGPIGVLCIRRSLADGRAAGFLSGLGAATADAIYGAIAALGLTAVTGALLSAQFWLRLGGGLFLVVLGVRTFLARQAEAEAAPGKPGGSSALAAYASTLALTLTNPMTILSFVAIFAGLGVSRSPALLVAGVFVGSAAWWWTLSSIADRLRRQLGGGLQWVNRASGVIIALFGAWALVSAAGAP